MCLTPTYKRGDPCKKGDLGCRNRNAQREDEMGGAHREKTATYTSRTEVWDRSVPQSPRKEPALDLGFRACRDVSVVQTSCQQLQETPRVLVRSCVSTQDSAGRLTVHGAESQLSRDACWMADSEPPPHSSSGSQVSLDLRATESTR